MDALNAFIVCFSKSGNPGWSIPAMSLDFDRMHQLTQYSVNG